MELRTPISLIAGSLGSGKTTLLKNILNTTDRRLAVLMNEFGEIAIDSQVIQGEHVQIVELAGGCACCALAGEFEAAVAEIVEKVAPELIVVEATGVAEADSLAYMVEDNLPQVRLDSVICIVDAYMSIKYPHVGYAARTQLQAADIVLINKIDLVTPEEVQEVEAQVRKYNDTAALFKTVRCDVDMDLLFGLDIEKRTIPIVHHKDVDFESFTFTTDRPLARAQFQQVIADLPPSVYRAKGFVRFAEGSYLFNYVVRRPELEEFPAEETQLVFIGPHLDETREAILSQLRDCEVNMPYQYLEDIATADVAFEAWGDTVEDMFVAAADATMNVMVESLDTIADRQRRIIHVEADAIDMLLFQLLQELIYYKDAERLLLRVPSVHIQRQNDGFSLRAEAYGEELDPDQHELLVDVKAVTLHRFQVQHTESGWKAMVILDI